ncbi:MULTISPECIES: glutathione S-transferase family protein [unclassified Comamonas]|uniref:glutathione S-transferase family protein n=1 Tax=unclassified Comamonas TaxID=2638500 RepID=UPI0003959CC0|nr:glutathione S-transferase N-terminal domain-containing protein [Comamonas sp. B-9]
MKLLGSLTSPYVRKVRVVLAEKKLDYRLETLDVWGDRATIASVNPLGKVPCLVLDDGSVLVDSRVIVEYLDTLSPVGRLIPSLGRERAEVRSWEAMADGVLDAAVLARMEYAFAGRSAEQRSPAWVERQLGKVWAGLEAMGNGLGQKTYFAGTGVHISLADIAVGCALAWLRFRFPELDWAARHPNLAQLLERLEARPSFAATQPEG